MKKTTMVLVSLMLSVAAASFGTVMDELKGAARDPDKAVSISVPVPQAAGTRIDAATLVRVRQFIMERENAHIDHMDAVSADPGHNTVSLLVWSTRDRYTFLQNAWYMLPSDHAAAIIIRSGLQSADRIVQSNGTGWYDGGLDSLLYQTVRSAYAALV